jgi:hypothetical protein
MRFFLVFFLGLPTLGLLAERTVGRFPAIPGSSMAEPRTTCLGDGGISTALQKLSSDNDRQVEQARAVLLSKVKPSPKCKKEIVAALMRAMDGASLDLEHNKASYYLWLHGADLLGDLKAFDALDLLISHLGLTRGFFSTSMGQQPAMRGVIKMGPMAIPKLDVVLLHSSDPKLRRSAVYCIASIGGPSAVGSLKHALASESDKCVSRFIRMSLESFDNKGNIKNRMEWFSGYLCSEG